MVSALSRLAEQPERYRNAYRAVATLLMLTLVPLAPIAILSADWLIPTVLGPRWTGAVPLFQVLALTLVARPLANTMGWLFISQARTGELWRWGLVGGAIALVSFVVGLPWGALGVAASYCAFDILVRMPILFVWVGRRGPVSVKDLVACMLPAWGVGGVVALVYGVLGPLSGLTGGARFAVFTPLSLLVGAGLMLATPWGREAARSGAKMFRALRQGGTG
jgi:PST family polysaccharide transporter